MTSRESEQEKFFRSGQTRSLSFRIEALRRLETAIVEKEEEILAALAEDLGKPKLEAYLSEVFFVKQEIRLYCRKLMSWAKPKRAGAPFYFFPSRNYIRRDPFGRILIVSPWNYPFQLALGPLISAVGGGNCVTLKPSEMAPATSRCLADLISGVFAPEHVCVVEGDASTSQELLSESFDIIFFTGSARVGKIVAATAAQTLTPVILELGGKCPVVVDRDVDLEITARRIAAAKFFNAGQTCIAPDFVVAPKEIHGQLCDLIEETVRSFYSEDLGGDLAHIVNEGQFQRLQGLLEGAGECRVIGEDDASQRLMAPRILPEAEWSSPCMLEEVFGPILPILKYTDEDDLIRRLQGYSAPLALYLFSRDEGFQERFIEAVPSGGIGINDLIKQSTNLDLPFGGVGGSGKGRYRGRFGFDAFTYQRAVCRRWFSKDYFEIHPPYQGKFETNRKFLK